MPETLEIKQVLTNLTGWACWDFKSYPLREEEARVVISALEEIIKEKGNATHSG